MSKDWIPNKIKGDFAESVCKLHFQAMGYSVEKIGIEDSAKVLVDKLSEKSMVTKFGSPTLNMLRTMPDFLISRPSVNTKGEILESGELQVFLVESKFISEISCLETYEAKLMWRYRNLIWKDTFLDYLLEKETQQYLKNNTFEKAHWLMKDDDVDNDIKRYANKQYKYTTDRFKKVPIIFYVLVPQNGILKKALRNYSSFLIKDNYLVKNKPDIINVFNDSIKENKINILCNFSHNPLWWPAGIDSYDKYTYYKKIINYDGKNYKSFNKAYTEDIKKALTEMKFSF